MCLGRLMAQDTAPDITLSQTPRITVRCLQRSLVLFVKQIQDIWQIEIYQAWNEHRHHLS